MGFGGDFFDMAKLLNRLTDVKIKKLGAGLHPDGDGLYLQVHGPTARSWIYRYWRLEKVTYFGLGPYPAVTLEDARRARDKWKRVRQAGDDPKAVRSIVRIVS